MKLSTKAGPAGFALLSLPVLLALPQPLSAQSAKEASNARLQEYVKSIQQIPGSGQSLLSSGALNLYRIAVRQTQKPTLNGVGDDDRHSDSLVRSGNATMGFSLSGGTMDLTLRDAAIPLSPGVVPVSDPSKDFQLSAVAGFTQSETSTAWCGNTVVVGYNDTGAFLRSLLTFPNNGLTLDGVGFSTDQGRTFSSLDLGAGGDADNFLAGDPVVACSSPTSFYYSTLFETATAPDSMGNRSPLAGIAVFNSNHLPSSGSMPAIAVMKDGNTHAIDKDWMTVDPKNHAHVFVTYTDFDSSMTSTTCGDQFRTAIEIVRSYDVGKTFQKPVVVHEECGDSDFVQGSQVLVDPNGKIQVAYEYFPSNGPRQIEIQTSINNAGSFAPPVVVSPLTATGDGQSLFPNLEGGFRTNEFPSLATDPITKDLYLAWTDATGNVVPDLFSYSGYYGYGNIVVSRSDNGGGTWSSPRLASPTPAGFTGRGRDQFMPGIAVDHSSRVAVCYYDRRNDPTNQRIDRYCSSSNTQGQNATDQRFTAFSFTPVTNADGITAPNYMGDYDTLASDSLYINSGFVGGFQIISGINPDVYAVKF
ncbi:MAG TPA: sialidase family protein [Acidisarcina sp.]